MTLKSDGKILKADIITSSKQSFYRFNTHFSQFEKIYWAGDLWNKRELYKKNWFRNVHAEAV